MVNEMTFTIKDILQLFSTFCAGIITVSAVIGIVTGWVAKIKQPESQQNVKIADIEKRVSEHDEKFKEYDNFFKSDDERFNIIEDETKILLKSVHALLKHELDDSDNQVIKDADEKLDAYLLNK
jgi:hypothetical protein